MVALYKQNYEGGNYFITKEDDDCFLIWQNKVPVWKKETYTAAMKYIDSQPEFSKAPACHIVEKPKQIPKQLKRVHMVKRLEDQKTETFEIKYPVYKSSVGG